MASILSHDAPSSTPQRPARLRSRGPLRQLHARGAGAVRDAGRGQPPHRARWKAGSRCSCSSAAGTASSSRRAGQRYFRHRARGARPDRLRHAPAAGQRPDERRLRIKLPPTFAIRWLVPRLARFHALHPRIDVQITTSHQRADFAREDVDVEHPFRARAARGPGLCGACSARRCCRCARRACCERGPPLRKPADLARHVLLCSMNRPNDWPTWLAAAGAPQIDGNSGLKFENAALAYQAAADQLGVMVALDAFVRDDLASAGWWRRSRCGWRRRGATTWPGATEAPLPERVQGLRGLDRAGGRGRRRQPER